MFELRCQMVHRMLDRLQLGLHRRTYCITNEAFSQVAAGFNRSQRGAEIMRQSINQMSDHHKLLLFEQQFHLLGFDLFMLSYVTSNTEIPDNPCMIVIPCWLAHQI